VFVFYAITGISSFRVISQLVLWVSVLWKVLASDFRMVKCASWRY